MGYDWFKMHSKGWLHGSIRAQLSPAERSVWADLLALANESRVRGMVCRAKGIPYTREYIASLLDIPLDLLNSTIDKCVKDENADDPRTRIMVDPDGCIRIANWGFYQAGKSKQDDKGEQAPLGPEDRQASQQAAAARLGYLQPEAARRGVEARELERRMKASGGEDLIDPKSKRVVGTFKPGVYICGFCEQTFTTADDLLVHWVDKHKETHQASFIHDTEVGLTIDGSPEGGDALIAVEMSPALTPKEKAILPIENGMVNFVKLLEDCILVGDTEAIKLAKQMWGKKRVEAIMARGKASVKD